MIAFLVAWLLALHRSERGWSPIPDFKGIANKIGELFEALKDFIGSGVGIVIQFAEAFVNAVIDMASSVKDLLLWFGTIAVNTLADVGSAIRDLLTWFVTVAINTLSGIGGAIRDLLTWFGTIAVNLVRDGFSAVTDLFTWFGTLISNSVGDAAGAVRDLVTWFGTQLVNIVTATAGGLVDGVTWLGTQLVNVLTSVGGALVERVEKIGTGVADVATSIEGIGETAAKKGIEGALDHKEDLFKALLGLGFPEAIIPLIIETIMERAGAMDGLKWAGNAAEEAGQKAFTEILKHTVGWGQVSPGDAPGNAATLFAAQVVIGTLLHATAIAKETVPFLDNSATAHLSGFLGSFTGWEKSLDLVFDAMVKNGLARPMEQFINEHTLTNLPSEGILSELLSRRDIDASVYDEKLAFHGYIPFWKEIFNSSSFRPARIFELVRIMQFTDINDADLDHLLNFASYPDKTIEILKPVLKAVALSRSTSRLLTEATEAFQKGFIDEGQYGGAMTVANVKPTEQGLWILAATAARNNEVKSELVSVWRSAAGRDAMTDDELRASLAVIGVTGGKADVEVLRAQAARLRKPLDDAAAELKKTINQTRTTLATAYRTQFRKGLIDGTQLAAQLASIGYAPELVNAFVALAQAEAAPSVSAATDDSPEAVSRRVRADLQQAYILQFQHDLIDAGTLRSSLVGIGVNDFEAASIVARESARKTPSPVEIANRTAERVAAEVLSSLKRAYAQQFQDGLISADALEQSVLAAGMDVDAAHAFRLLQEAISFTPDANGASAAEKLHARQLQAARQAAAIEEFRVGIIDAATMNSDLVAAGIFADVAAALVETELARAAGIVANDTRTAAQRQADQLQAAQKAAAIQQFRSAIIDDAALDDALVAAGITPEIAGAIVARETARTTKAAADAQARLDQAAALALENAQNAAAVQAFRSDLITDADLEATLIANGVAPDLAVAIVDREVFRKVKPATVPAAGL